MRFFYYLDGRVGRDFRILFILYFRWWRVLFEVRVSCLFLFYDILFLYRDKGYMSI